MKRVSMFIGLVCLLIPLTLQALPLNSMPSMNSNTTLFFFNTLYSTNLFNLFSNNQFTPGNTNPYQSQPLLTQQTTPTVKPYINCNIIPANPTAPECPAAPVPEPSTMLLVGSGMVGLATFRKYIKHTRN